MAKKRTKRQGAPGKGSAPPTGGTKDEADLEKDDAGASESESDERASAPDGESPESPTEGEAEAKSESDGAESDAAESDAAESKAEESKADAGAAEEEPAGEKLAARTAEDGDAPAKDRKAPPKGAAWGEPFARFEAAWTKLETRLITWVLVAQLISMVSWVLLNGLSSPVQSGNLSGLVIRQVLGALGLGLGAYFATRKLPSTQRSLATIAGIVLGVAIAKSWRSTGVDYFDNVKAWLQEGSTLTLMGGLRGVATRASRCGALARSLGGHRSRRPPASTSTSTSSSASCQRLRKPIALVNYCAPRSCASPPCGDSSITSLSSPTAPAPTTRPAPRSTSRPSAWAITSSSSASSSASISRPSRTS
ncbi:MAG: hypothetical protein R3B70_26005 [Polyangiaceae bacterium]